MRSRADRSTPFVGRDREVALLAGIVADDTEAHVALIGGEGGLGKTRLVDEVVARRDDIAVVRAGAVPRPTPIPFEMIHAATGRAPGSAPPGGEVLAEQIRAEAEAVRSRHDGPVVYVFEDVHWADRESLEVVERLAVAAPLVASLLITYRPNQLRVEQPATSFLQRIERRSGVTQIRLEPLRADDIASYLDASDRSVDARTVELVHSRTGGNPLLLTELVAATDDRRELTEGLPWTLAEILRPTIEQLPAELRAVAEAAAVLGAEVDFDMLAAAVALDERELLSRLRALVGSGILVETGDDTFGYRHDLVREAVAEGLFTRERRRIHAAVHDALVAAGSDDVVAVVTHAAAAGRIDAAADAARAGARAALTAGHSQLALNLAEQALLAGEDVDTIRTAVVAGWLSGNERVALDHLDAWDDLLEPDTPERAEVLHHRIRLYWELGDQAGADRAAARLTTLVDSLAEGPEVAQGLADLAQHEMLSGRTDAAIALADRAIEVADRLGDVAAGPRLQARVERASARASVDQQAATDELLRAADEAELAGDHVLVSRALHNAVFHPLVTDVGEHVERMRRASLRAGLTCIATDGYRQALIVMAEGGGDHEAFATLLEAALEDLPDNAEIAATGVVDAADRGDAARARQLAERITGEMRKATHALDWVEVSLALLAAEGGDPADLRRWLASAPSTAKSLRKVLHYASRLLDAGIEADLAPLIAGVDGAALNDPALVGLCRELLGDHEVARERYELALGDGRLRPTVERAELHLGLARVATATGGTAGSHECDALGVLERWPCVVGARLARRVEPGRAPDRTRPDELLTPREREVARLVARGLTNGGIADELYISTKTASVHVSNILAKLGMSSRAEIAAWVAGGGLPGAAVVSTAS